MELGLGEKRKISIREVYFEGLLEGNRERMSVAQDGPGGKFLVVSEEHQEFQNVSLSEHCKVIWEPFLKCPPGCLGLIDGGFSEGVDQGVLATVAPLEAVYTSFRK